MSPMSFVSSFLACVALQVAVSAQTLLDPSLQVATIVSGLDQPIAMVFLGSNDILVTEKATGVVKRVTNGVVVGTVLDLAVNSASERGLLGIALHPSFPADPGVYLFHTESSTGVDTNAVGAVATLGHRVDRFVWNGSSLVFAQTLLRIRAFQEDLNTVTNPQNPFSNPAPLQRGNHNGGVLRFGADGKLYVIVGDVGRRGWLQNNFAGPVPDDPLGGPIPDQVHTSGVVFRLNPDGSIPGDNPLWGVGQIVGSFFGGTLGADVGDSIKRLYAIGVRNSFGMTVDPLSGSLWTSENGGRAFDEINRLEPGWNGGWVQVMGPIDRILDYKMIEVGVGIGAGGPVGLQQLRWPATNIADNAVEAAQRLVPLIESRYRDPQFSWKHVVPPAGLGFVPGNELGVQYCGDLLVGSAVFRPTLSPPSVLANPGQLYRFKLNAARTSFVFNDPALQDKVADNLGRDDWQTEGSEILFGTDFGIVSDIVAGPEGHMYLVSPSSGTIRKIWKP
jgi:aldose sugar dehydrogenase